MLVGSYSQPAWLIDRARLGERLPARVRARELWRVDDEWLSEAQDDATVLAVADQVSAGVDVVTDGEARRESYSNRFANSLEGLDVDQHGTSMDRTGKEVPVPRVIGPIRRVAAVEVAGVELLRRVTYKPIKMTLPGPFTMAQQAQNDFYDDDGELAMAYAAALNEEVLDLFTAGVDIVQLDEPYVQARPGPAAEYAVEAIDRALVGASGPTALHVCFGYGAHVADKPQGYAFLSELDGCAADEISIEAAQPRLDLSVLDALPSKRVHLGVLDLRAGEIETAEVVADRVRAGLEHIPADRLVVSPDCGMKYLPRDIAYRKLEAMVAGTRIVREEVA
ncbi:MAG: cobalamin-independent methionine synthase II family protein [Actinomycetota bacterium]|nr:cobalamin-independent methionine synthase II family protein [Actinomycetota bacterium]